MAARRRRRPCATRPLASPMCASSGLPDRSRSYSRRKTASWSSASSSKAPRGWTSRESTRSARPAAALVERLVNDAHPPWFNLFGRGILALTGDAIVSARLVNLALVCGVLGGGLYSLRGLPADLRWRLFLLIVASAGVVGLA